MTDSHSFVLFDTPERSLLYPFTDTRSIAQMRYGILTVKERWELLLSCKASILTADYLQENNVASLTGLTIFINAAVFPDEEIVGSIIKLKAGDVLIHKQTKIAFCTNQKNMLSIQDVERRIPINVIEHPAELFIIKYPWHLIQGNHKAIVNDFHYLTKGKTSKSISSTNKLIASENIFMEEAAVAEHCIINASAGPVYIGRNATMMEGCMIRGPFVLAEGAILKMGTTVYGATTIGPYCSAGGEIKNTVMMGFSNKAHHGYLGDAVIGEWCNLGAGTSNSNVKNNAADILITQPGGNYINAGLKCGVMMGDYTRCAINTSFNTATFAGIASNIFGEGLTPKIIPSFTWGYTAPYEFDKALMHIANWKKLKNHTLTATEINILEHLYKQKLQ